MRELSLRNFQEYCLDLDPITLKFDTTNQPDGEYKEAQAVVKFPIFGTTEVPNRIYFKNGDGTLCLNGVNSVQIFDENPEVGLVFKFVCRNETYTFLADRMYSESA